jgi:hypothetical protein
MVYFRFLIVAILISSFQETYPVSEVYSGKKDDVRDLWLSCNLGGVLSYDLFSKAFSGYNQMAGLRKKNIMTIIDFSRPSTEKRCYVIDMDKRKLLYQCLVAHGRNSGDNYAGSFSNENGSLKSSLGFYITGETYSGKHGYSLRLDGLEKDINDNARSREIVIHGADYVTEDFIKAHGRLGRSWGCPALSPAVSKEVIDTICSGSCLFIYGTDPHYFKTSSFFSTGKKPGG